MSDFFEKIIASAIKFKNNIAIIVDKKSFTYWEIICQAFTLSRQFLKFQDKNRFCVVISDKTINFYVGMLACFFSNSVYIPLNIQSGIEKSKKILETLDSYFIFLGDAKADVLLNLLSQVKNKDILCLTMSHKNKLKLVFEANNFCYIANRKKTRNKSCVDNNFYHCKIKKENYAYMFFTSGSTGKPKAVPISHKNLSTYVNDILHTFHINAQDRFIQLSDIAFDISIHEIVLCLISGATLYVYNEEKELSVSQFIYKNKITHCILVPSIMPAIINQCHFYHCHLFSLRNTFFCGEPFPVSFAQLWQKEAKNTLIVNLYGPTEATVSCTYHIYQKENNYSGMMSLPIGKPFPHTQLAISNNGELIISGDQVSNGYWPSFTTDKFSYNSESDLTSYFTGDRVSYHDEYGYLFQGRFDDQWQVKGHRVEKHEVESVLRTVLNCHDICVIPEYDQHHLIQSLVGFSTQKINISQLKKKLLSHLSREAIPKKIVTVAFLPHLSNGKIDYQLLQENYHAL